MNDLKEKARRAFYAIKKSIQIDIPIRIWLKIFKSVIEPIALYGSEVWGPLTESGYEKWDKHPVETLHAEFCKNILKVGRNTPNNACRAELGQYPLLINIEKRATKFFKHLKTSDPKSFCYQALKSQEMGTKASPLIQMVWRLTQTNVTNQTNPTNHQPQDLNTIAETIRPNQVINTEKQNYLSYWTETTKNQNKLQCYLALNRKYTLADYLSTVTNTKHRKTLTRYRLSNHSLAIEKGRHRQTWLPREERLCTKCNQDTIETELHFLNECSRWKEIRNQFFPKFTNIHPEFPNLEDNKLMRILLGEEQESARVAASYVDACHRERESPHE